MGGVVDELPNVVGGTFAVFITGLLLSYLVGPIALYCNSSQSQITTALILLNWLVFLQFLFGTAVGAL